MPQISNDINELAAHIANLPAGGCDALLYSAVFDKLIPSDVPTGGPASVLAGIIVNIPDGSRTEAIANLLAGLFNQAPTDVYGDIVDAIAAQTKIPAAQRLADVVNDEA